MNSKTLRRFLIAGIAAALWAASPSPVAAQTVGGTIYNMSVWTEQLVAPPGDGDGYGQARVALFYKTNDVHGVPLTSSLLASGLLPLNYGPYSFTLGSALADGAYTVVAWIDGNTNGLYDLGEPFGAVDTGINLSNSVPNLSVVISDDSNKNGMADWWEYHWFQFTPNPFGQDPDSDLDKDGYTTREEAEIATAVPGLASLSPINWDTDGDGMDDRWEVEHYVALLPSVTYTGMNACVYNRTDDFDGDGLSDWQEYCGVDRIPRMQLKQVSQGIAIGRGTGSTDDLNPLDIDTDYDLLIDSFEAAWYDPESGIDPHQGVMSSIPTTTNVDTSIARADPDQDGLSNYREQCLLAEFRQSGVNGDKWVWENRVPFPYSVGYTFANASVRVCKMEPVPLALGLDPNVDCAIKSNRDQLRNHEWTDPTDGTGYNYPDEDIPPGHDTDNDWLPDGWEVQFNLDPRDDGLSVANPWTNGPFGDPDNDGVFNIDEFFGQDGQRSTTKPYVNGTGDETNPNEYNYRPDSTYKWRWAPLNPLISLLTDPRVGTGISRVETLGSALPTTSIGVDVGTDTDDDGIPDDLELYPTNGAVSCPVVSCDPFIPRSILITGSNGIAIPDPEPSPANGQFTAGTREDLQKRDWTIECQVKLLGTNLTGDLFDFETRVGTRSIIIYRLSLSNNVPVLIACNELGQPQVIKANALPTNRWVHLAGVWSHADNSLGLYVGGILYNAKENVGESFSSRFMYPATNRLALATSPNGSFINRLLLDEVRIWGTARSSALIAEFSGKLVPLGNGDDVWIDNESPQYYTPSDTVLVNGGSLFEGEPGVLLPNVCRSANQVNYWIDDGDRQFNAAWDIVLRRDTTLVEGLAGSLVGNVRWCDKDGDGVYSRDNLLAYYRFDDGGRTIEDFARPAKNGLVGASVESYLYGDRGYALPTNGCMWVTYDTAPIFGVDKRGADDSDHDGMPDAWELVHHLDPWDDGTHGESATGAKDGPNGAHGDPDGDGLMNIYEYWAGTNPQDGTSEGDGVLDSQKDRDSDGVVNITEQKLGSRPDIADTDDDGLTDNEEQGLSTSPVDPSDPSHSRAIVLNGAPDDYLEIPLSIKQRLTDMTLEAWIQPTNAIDGAGTIIRRVIQNLPGGTQAMNYVMGTEPNGSGGLRLYAGYIMPDGRSFIVRGGLVPTGAEWTHVAMTYNSLNATLTLYTNGVPCAATNVFYEAPRVNGLGGESFVRIGEGFLGGIDELRVWSTVRNSADILAGMTNAVTTRNAEGLVHFFRFDDGEATTNGTYTQWTEFHQPGGLQDSTYTQDWNEQWRHAARPHGAYRLVEPGAMVPPPSLRVILAPAKAILGGAKWQLSGGEWQDSGVSLQGLAPGSHTVSFKSIAGWTEPLSIDVILTNGVATTLTNIYVEKATLSVSLGPQAALDAGMKWKVDNGAWQDSGAVVENLSTGIHALAYMTLDGYTDPAVKSVTLSAGETRTMAVQYTVTPPSLRVLLAPERALLAGAQWQIAGGEWQDSGVTLNGLSAGAHTVLFKTVAGWSEPSPVVVTLGNGAVVTLTNAYIEKASLSVSLAPQAALDAGMQWRVDGGPWQDSGSLVQDLTAGTHVLSYTPLPGYIEPIIKSVDLFPGEVRLITGHYTSMLKTISGSIYNSSLWQDRMDGPPGDGNGYGQLCVGLFESTNNLNQDPVSIVTSGSGPLPFAFGPYAFTVGGSLVDGVYTLVAWVDGNENDLFDVGEPFGLATAVIANSNSVSGVAITITDDSNKNSLPDWWEYHWFRYTTDPFSQKAADDPDGDGLSNGDEYRIASTVPGLSGLSPSMWDTDDDGMDDKWEYGHFLAIPPGTVRFGMNPCLYNRTDDFDGDGLSDWQEYCGVNGIPIMQVDTETGGIIKGRVNPQVADDLNPLDIDTDFDLLIDSFEAAWYDPGAGIDPHAGVMADIPASNNVNVSIASADPDADGLSNYREQCLLTNLWQSSANSNKWVWEGRVPFPQAVGYKDDGTRVRFCVMDSPLALGLDMESPWVTKFNRDQLRNHAWTDPTEGTGYYYVDEDIPPGHDTDNDWLPDGWEVQHNLNPRDDGMTDSDGANGPFGDPDGDGLLNIDEFFGQDGKRSVTRPFINGTGDETNPNEYNHRPDSTYAWRWMPADPLVGSLTDPRAGNGVSRVETLGSALPTTSLGVDSGVDTDEDGIPDSQELYPSNGVPVSSPVHSCDPFLPQAALITSPNGIPIPDPEPATAHGVSPAGTREDLQRRDWTIECQVKLLGTNLTGSLFNFETAAGGQSIIIYRLALSNNIPVLVSYNELGQPKMIRANALPTNRWVHLAGVWDHAANSLGLYVGGVLYNAMEDVGESFSSRYMLPATNQLALAAAPDGSFTNRLMLDEVRIWGVARSSELITRYAGELVPVGNGDDVWIDRESSQYYGQADAVLVNGGSLFEGEPGVLLSNVCQSASGANTWIDDGDGQYNAPWDVVLRRDATLVEGLQGTLVGNVRWCDKDGDGVFSRDSLLAYYRFDDGGRCAEDFARHAKNGLLGATFEDLPYGDQGYALRTGFTFVTNDAAPVLGVDQRGADDSDHDGMPDAWEVSHNLDPWDDGSHGESTLGAKDGPNGAKGDPDGDGLINIYEYWSGTNPHAADSDGDSTLDAQEDRDGDGVVNITEQQLGSRPDMVDTDDDGLPDNEEQGLATSPVDPTDPPVSRALAFGGAADDYVELPLSSKQRLTDMTLEAWVKPTNAVDGAGTIIRRVIQNLAGGTQAVNYVLGLESNGSGGLRAYAGYSMPDGRSFIVRGGIIPVDATWTHLAATYSSLSATLTLYTNGMIAVSTNTFYEAPRVNGMGGETFVRVGEQFAGAIDEVRLWSVVRSAADIRSGMTNVFASGVANGLVHFFRFDDGEATTNSTYTQWTAFHQPGGLQDFTYSKDWNAQWRHAARKHGAVISIEPGAIVPPPSLRVILGPDRAVLAGAQWQLSGGEWQNSGASLPGLAPGQQIVLFKGITNWTEPLPVEVFLTNGTATTLTNIYVEKASISVSLSPQEAVAAGMQWKVDNGAWQGNGAVVQNLKAGLHAISFTHLDGYIDPIIKSVDLTPGEARTVVAQYVPIYGGISVLLQPADAVSNGARWQVSGSAWQTNGAVLSPLPLADYSIVFQSLARWETPDPVTVSLTGEGTVVVTGRYVRVPGIEVQITPAQAVLEGAQWRLAGGDWNNSGAFVKTTGTYTVQFKELGHWLVPGDQSVAVVTQQLAVVVGTYLKGDVFGGTVGTNAGQFNQPRGIALDARHRLYVADTYNDRVQVYNPYDQSWSVWGARGTNAGQFDKPSSLTLDPQGNVYVVDANNNRIQKWTSGGVWLTNWGTYGSAVGQFIGPADVAVDSRTNVYVADLFNDRVQKRSPAGTWSLALTNGNPAPVKVPKGLMVDASDNVYVADDGMQTNGLSRIQKFNTNGQLVALLGSASSSEGGLRRPGGMAIGDNFYVADIDNSRVACLPMSSNAIWATYLGSNVLSKPEDVLWDPRGFLYIADTLHHRVLGLPVTPDGTNGLIQYVGSSSNVTNGSFLIEWFARSNWFYAIQYAGSMDSGVWLPLGSATNILGKNVTTNYIDTTVGTATSRFYRIFAY